MGDNLIEEGPDRNKSVGFPGMSGSAQALIDLLLGMNHHIF